MFLRVVREAEKGLDEPFVLTTWGERGRAFKVMSSVAKKELGGLEGLVEIPLVTLRYLYKVLPLLWALKPDQELRS